MDDRAAMTMNAGVRALAKVAKVNVAFPFIHDAVDGSHISSLKLILHLNRNRLEPFALIENPDGRVADLFRNESIPFMPIATSRPTANEAIGKSADSFSLARSGLLRARTIACQLEEGQVDIVHTDAVPSDRTDVLDRFGMKRHALSIMRVYDQLLEGPRRSETILAPEPRRTYIADDRRLAAP